MMNYMVEALGPPEIEGIRPYAPYHAGILGLMLGAHSCPDLVYFRPFPTFPTHFRPRTCIHVVHVVVLLPDVEVSAMTKRFV